MVFVSAVFAVLLSVVVADPNAAAPCGTIAAILQGGCSVASDNKAFVDCNLTTKTCYCLPTFQGNASINNPCTCPSPKLVHLSATLSAHLPGGNTIAYGQPYCFDLPGLQAQQAAAVKNQKHIAAVIQFFNNTIGDTPTRILSPGLPGGGDAFLHDILSDNVRSRISPAGEFNGFEGVVEYFYGFVANPSLRVTNVDYRSIAARGNTVAAKANLWLLNQNAALTGGFPPALWNLTTFAFFTFDSSDKIASIDVSVPNLGAILDIPDSLTIPNPAGGPPITAFQIKQGIIRQTCQLMTVGPPAFPNGFCGAPLINVNPPIWAGANPAAATLTCQQFMNTIPYGTRERNNANSFACRQLHSGLIPFRQNPHCFHSGPDGGVGVQSPACIEFAYSDYYLVDY
jgi:hypothetical protein